MDDLPLALALTAGMLAAVNPCGFALLPAYLSLLVLGEDSPSRGAAVGRALAATAAMTLGFAAVFGLFGLVVAPLAGQVQQHLPWFTVVFGLLLACAGVWLLAGRQLPTLLPRVRRAPGVTGSVPSMALFGGAYAVASLGCTIAPFLAVVVSAFRSGSTAGGLLLFGAYTAGMGAVVGTAALAVALARTSALGRLRRMGAAASRVGGGLVVLAGAYTAYYGWYEIRSLSGGATSDPVIEAASTVQRTISAGLEWTGLPLVAAAFVVLLTVAVVRVRGRGRRSAVESRREGEAGREHVAG
ncbi:cytochrome c biogenesis CcdA family protein [Streptomyces sp. WMMB 322]|uniref:cytochrome c biogenesis CcdA family protein n=1 Tax=Streptomyces sp. WMMB 322 TaxID=1286821 RepID=UPI0006E2283B|nr:cytochrome c biogenesis CcdA family protein [Streptomyces sp. WMMB 322]SCK36146.1 Cytochrome c biogenesis protein CcdA [Streptomyces sp. WMMB 322]